MDVEEEKEEEEDDVEADDVVEEDRSQESEAHFARACAVEMRTDISEEPLCVKLYRKNAGRQSRSKHFVRACAVDMHMDIPQETCHKDIYIGNAGRPGCHLDKTPGLNTYRNHPSAWPH